MSAHFVQSFDTLSDEGVPQYSPHKASDGDVSPVTSPIPEKPPRRVSAAEPPQRMPSVSGARRVDQWRQNVTGVDHLYQTPTSSSRAPSVRSLASSSASGSMRGGYDSSSLRPPLSQVEEGTYSAFLVTRLALINEALAQRQFQLAQQQLLLAAQRLALAGAAPALPDPALLYSPSAPLPTASPLSDAEYLTPAESLPSPLDSPIPFEIDAEVNEDYKAHNDGWRSIQTSSTHERRPSSSATAPSGSAPRPTLAGYSHVQAPTHRSIAASRQLTASSSAPASARESAPRLSNKQAAYAAELASAAQSIERTETAPPSYSALPPFASLPSEPSLPPPPSQLQPQAYSSPLTSSTSDPFARRFQAPVASPLDFDHSRSISPAVQSEISVQEFHGFRPRVNSTSSTQMLSSPLSTGSAAYGSFGRSSYSYARPSVPAMSMPPSQPRPVVPYSRPALVPNLPAVRPLNSSVPYPAASTIVSPNVPNETSHTIRRIPSANVLNTASAPPLPPAAPAHPNADALAPLERSHSSSSSLAPSQAPSADQDRPDRTTTSTSPLRTRVRALRERVMSPHVRFKSPSPEEAEAKESLVEDRIRAQRGTIDLANVEKSLSMLL